MQRLCSQCGEPISPKRLAAVPEAHQCFDCANQAAGASGSVARPKSIATKPIVTLHHLRRATCATLARRRSEGPFQDTGARQLSLLPREHH